MVGLFYGVDELMCCVCGGSFVDQRYTCGPHLSRFCRVAYVRDWIDKAMRDNSNQPSFHMCNRDIELNSVP